MKRFLLASLTVFFFSACGGAQDNISSTDDQTPDPSMGAEDFQLSPALTRGEFTTEVDDRRFRSVVEPTTEFLDNEPIVYFVGRLKNLPPESQVEIKWYFDQTPEPMLSTTETATGKYQFIASFRPTEEKFFAGHYTVRIYANGKEVNARSFQMSKSEINEKGPKISDIKFSKRVGAKAKPKSPKTNFPVGTDSMFVSFNVANAEFGTSMSIRWMRGLTQFHEDTLEINANKRYSATIQSLGGLPEGTYSVELYIGNSSKKVRQFVIGEASSGPGVAKIAFGLELNPSNMPNKPMTVFERDTQKIHCGIRFMDLPESTVIEVQWTHMDKTGESLLFKNRMKLSSGGSGTMGAAWEPGYRLIAGDYKAVVLVNGEFSAEEPFQVE